MAYTKMKPEYKTPWLAALRSDDYGQAQSVLYGGHDGDGRETYCCLGVLCTITSEIEMINDDSQALPSINTSRQYGLKPELSRYKTRSVIEVESGEDFWEDSWEDNLVDGELNVEMMTFFGISPAAQTHLVKMNDDMNKSFAEIADWVEKNL